MPKYLQEAEHIEAMTEWSKRPEDRAGLLVYTAWTHDFMAAAHHNIPCPVCFDAAAVLTRNVTPGQWDQKAQPCGACQKEGWQIRQPWWRDLFGLGPRRATS